MAVIIIKTKESVQDSIIIVSPAKNLPSTISDDFIGAENNNLDVPSLYSFAKNPMLSIGIKNNWMILNCPKKLGISPDKLARFISAYKRPASSIYIPKNTYPIAVLKYIFNSFLYMANNYCSFVKSKKIFSISSPTLCIP